ncbi:MAG TPA: thiol reductant ABC exporter subunit CydC, partial [Acidocella sp.]|nr:thiol reductant ABC exporter subunit CydC [Acidocella sp.]
MRDFRRLLGLLRGEWGWALGGMLLSAGVILANAGLLALSGWFIAAMALAGHGGPTLDYFAPAAAIRGLAILRAFGRYGERLATHDATFRLLTRLRVWVYEKLEPLAPAGLQYHRTGDLLSRMRADIDRLESLYLRVLVPSAAAAFSVPVMLICLAWLLPGAALLDLAGLAAAGLALPLLAQRLGREAGAQAAALRGRESAELAERLHGFAELLVDGALPAHLAQSAATARALRAAQRRQGWIGWWASAGAQLSAQLSLWCILILALPLVSRGALSGPDLALLALFILASFEAVGGLPGAYQALGETMAAARRIFEIADARPATSDPAAPAAAPARFDLRAEALRMRYAPALPPVFQGLDFAVPEGGCLGITGPSGAGKSTLLNLILRFWDYESGSLRLGGTELRALEGETLRGLCTVVAQRTHLFNTSIRENLRIARPDADDATLRAALRDAALLDEVLAMPAGLETLVGEAGTSLSGGQARRLSI